MLRKVLWSGLVAGISAGAAMAASKAASSIWRLTTGDEPPSKR